MAVRCAHHRDLNLLIGQPGHASGPLAFDGESAFELEAQLPKEGDRRGKIFDDDPDVVHPLQCHAQALFRVRRFRRAEPGWSSFGAAKYRSIASLVTSWSGRPIIAAAASRLSRKRFETRRLASRGSFVIEGPSSSETPQIGYETEVRSGLNVRPNRLCQSMRLS